MQLTGIRDGRLTLQDRTIPLAGRLLTRLTGYLDHRSRTWPATLNAHLFINRKTAPRTAPRTTPVSRNFPITAALRYVNPRASRPGTTTPSKTPWSPARIIEILSRRRPADSSPSEREDPTRMTSPQPERILSYAADLTSEDVIALETFLNTQLGRVYEEVGETGETSFAMQSLLILVSDSAGFLHALLRRERPDPWQRAAIVREWQRLRSTAHPFNHCDGFDHDRWWNQVRYYDHFDESAERERILRFADDAVDEGRGPTA